MSSSSTDSDSDLGYLTTLPLRSDAAPKSSIQLPSISDLPLSESQSFLFNQIQTITPSSYKMVNSQLPTTKFYSGASSTLMVSSSHKKSSNSTSSHSKSSWSQEEDEVLLNAVSGKSTINWEYVASIDGKHTPKQCRERWLVKLNPDVRRSPFETWEDEIIQNERQKIGNHWSLIAQLLPGRTSCSVKNRWYTVLRYKQAKTQMIPNYPSFSSSTYRPPVYRNVIY